MEHINTTQTTINKIKLLAKKLKKEKGIQLSKAQEEASIEFGYDNFHHVHDCFKNTKSSN